MCCHEPFVVSAKADPEHCCSRSIQKWGGIFSSRIGSLALDVLNRVGASPPDLLSVSQHLQSWHALDSSAGCLCR